MASPKRPGVARSGAESTGRGDLPIATITHVAQDRSELSRRSGLCKQHEREGPEPLLRGGACSLESVSGRPGSSGVSGRATRSPAWVEPSLPLQELREGRLSETVGAVYQLTLHGNLEQGGPSASRGLRLGPARYRTCTPRLPVFPPVQMPLGVCCWVPTGELYSSIVGTCPLG